MALNGSGAYSAPSNSFNPAVATTLIESAAWNSVLADLTTVLSTALYKDGQQTATQVIPFAAGIQTDTVAEKTSAAGVTVDNVLIKDGSVNPAKGANVASATSTDIWATTGQFVHITGTTTITGFGTAPRAGAWRFLEFDDALILTHGANLDLPGAANITTAAGDRVIVLADTTTAHRVLFFQRASGAGLVPASTTDILTGTDTTKFATADAVAALWEQGSDVASAGTISLGEGGYFNITGTTTITDVDFATDKAGRSAWVKFADILTFTHGASLILPGAANITTAAGDTACLVSEGTDVVRCVSYTKAASPAGGGLPAASSAEMEAASSSTVAATPGNLLRHPGVAKASGNINTNSGTPSLLSDDGVTGIADTGTGVITVTMDNTFSDANQVRIAGAESVLTANGAYVNWGGTKTTTTFTIETFNSSGSAIDLGASTNGNLSFSVFGDLA